MQKKWFYCLLAGLACLHTASVYSNCSSDHCGGKTVWKDSKPKKPGCETLQVTITNDTKFNLVLDTAYHPSTTIGSTSDFEDIGVGKTEMFSVTGVNIDSASHQDEVDTSVRYIAKSTDDLGASTANAGAQFVITLKKSSCNSSDARLKMDDHRCYYSVQICSPCWKHNTITTCCSWGGCVIGDFKCSGDNHGCPLADDLACGDNQRTPDDICYEQYDRYKDIDCHNALTSGGDTLAQNSGVQTSAGLYTGGGTASVNEDGTFNTPEDSSVTFSTSSNFTCNQSSECGGDDKCSGGEDTYNKPSQLVFHVHASPIETLTINFFSKDTNTQASAARMILNSLYNNLGASYLGQLGTYYSLQPVKVEDNQQAISFSTLCNSANCQQA